MMMAMISGIALERGFEHGAAVHARQPQVGNDDVEGELGEARQRVLAVRGLLDDEAVIRQPFRDGLTQRRLVVYEEQMFRVFSHLVVRRYFDTRGDAVNELRGRAVRSPRPYRRDGSHSDNTSAGRANDDGSQDHIDHEGVRAGRRQPPHDLQLDRQRQGRVRANGRRLGPDLRRHALARTRAGRRADAQRSLMMPAADRSHPRGRWTIRATWDCCSIA